MSLANNGVIITTKLPLIGIAKVAADDVVFLPGDFSWATKADALAPDMHWLSQRPGQKNPQQGQPRSLVAKIAEKLGEVLPEKLRL